MKPHEQQMSRLQAWALKLNRRQTRALVFGLALCAVAGLYPYWYFVRTNELGGVSRDPAGFYFIGDPPKYLSTVFSAEARVDWGVLFVIELVCCAITAVTIYGLRDKNNEAGSTYGQYR